MNNSNLKALNKIINNQKLIYSIYVYLKNIYWNKKGRNFKVPLVYQIIITIFKIKYNFKVAIMTKLLFTLDSLKEELWLVKMQL